MTVRKLLPIEIRLGGEVIQGLALRRVYGPRPNKIRRDLFIELYQTGLSLREIGDAHGLSAEAVRLTLARAGYLHMRPQGRYGKPQIKKPTKALVEPVIVQPVARKVWCAQCDHAVHPAEAKACRSQFCKAKVAA